MLTPRKMIKDGIKLLCSLLIFVGFIGSSFAQVDYQSSFVHKDKYFVIKAEKSPQAVYKTHIKLNSDSTSFELINFNISDFATLFQKALTQELDTSLTVNEELVQLSNKEFFNIYTWFASRNSSAPIAGNMSFSNSVAIYADLLNHIYRERKKVESKLKKAYKKERIDSFFQSIDSLKREYGRLARKLSIVSKTFKPDSLHMEIQDGSIRNLLVFGQLEYSKSDPYRSDPNCKVKSSRIYFHQREMLTQSTQSSCSEPVVYRNYHPIGLSALSDVETMWEIKLRNLHNRNDEYDLELRSLIKYKPHPNSNSDDYSPKDSVYRIIKDISGSLPKTRVFYKEKTKYLFVGRIFSDFIGMGEDEPNGLIQTEISKKVILNSQEKYYVIGNSINVDLTLSKIESNNRDLTIVDSTTSSLQLFQYSFLHAGLDLNLLKVDIPRYKLVLSYNFGAGFYWTSLTFEDSASFSKSSYAFRNTFKIEFRPDSRWGFDVRYYTNKLRFLDTDFKTNYDIVHSYELNGYWRPNPDKLNEAFFRVGVYHDASRAEFNKIQIGYAFQLIKQ